MDLHEVITNYHDAADKFSRGDPLPVKKIFSHQDDVTLANPFGPPAHGWNKVSEALDFASARFRDGKVTGFEMVQEYVTSDLATILEIEHWNAKVSGRSNVDSFDLRVTSTFRREEGTWKLIHRHADPLTTFHPDGPLRNISDNKQATKRRE